MKVVNVMNFVRQIDERVENSTEKLLAFLQGRCVKMVESDFLVLRLTPAVMFATIALKTMGIFQ